MINPSYMLDESGITCLRQGLILNNSNLNHVNQTLLLELMSFQDQIYWKLFNHIML